MSIQTLLTQTFKLVTLVATGSIGETHTVELTSWLRIQEDLRGAFWSRNSKSYRAPQIAIIGANATFRSTLEAALVTQGVRGPSTGTTDTTPFPITALARQNWKCVTRMANGEILNTTSILEDFTLTLTSTIPKASALLATMGGYARVRIVYPSSRPTTSPCSGLPDLTGVNATYGTPGLRPISGPFVIKPAPLAGRTVIPLSARIEFRPERVNWEYWNAPAGFGPEIRHEGYCAAPGAAE